MIHTCKHSVFSCGSVITKVKHPHLQLLSYLLNIWQAQIKQNQQLTPVIPIIVYHGKERWSYQPFESRFPGIDDLLACYLPRFEYRLIDLGSLSDEEIKLRVFSKVALKLAVLVMKDHRDEDLVLGHFCAIMEIGRRFFEQEKGLHYLESVIRYVLNTTEIEDKILVDTITAINNKGGEIAMSTAERLIEKGRNEGMQIAKSTAERLIEKGRNEGIQQGQLDAMLRVAKSMLERGDEVAEIAGVTGLGEKEIRKLMKGISSSI